MGTIELESDNDDGPRMALNPSVPKPELQATGVVTSSVIDLVDPAVAKCKHKKEVVIDSDHSET